MIELINITKKYSNKTVFENLNFGFEENKITAIMGESGCGKTTLLNILANLTDYSGKIESNYKNVAYVFSNNRLIPNLTVKQNLELINPNINLTDYLKLAELNTVADLYPKELSSGMAHRVSLLRAFIHPADLLLMDEPFRNLDITLKFKLIKLFKELWQKNKPTVLIVSHSIEDVLNLADNVAIIKNSKFVFNEKTTIKNIDKKIIDILTN
ncbi:MAG: ABC transporter ATP-binding protein [Clostridia bacterium]|nr:ABC transporter ATP-binding protein [Clostridia bacterium]